MENKRKGKMGRGDGCCAVLPDELLFGEVLPRLPAKSLMRFKCVSKFWLSTISSCPGFCNAHRVRSQSRPSLVMVSPPDSNSHLGFFYANLPLWGGGVLEVLPMFGGRGGFKKTEEEVFYANLPLRGGGLLEFLPMFGGTGGFKKEEEGAPAMDGGKYYYHGVTEVINGLFCMFSVTRAAVCNVSTHEVMGLPRPPPPPPPPPPFSVLPNPVTKFYRYYLGFVSSSKEYKLLRVCSFEITRGTDENYRYIRFCSQGEILTLGANEDDAAWRRVRGVPPICLSARKQSVHINGTCYWWRTNRNCVFAFSFEEEKFRRISRPPSTEIPGNVLHEFGGYLSVTTASGLMDQKLKLWVLDKEAESPPLSEQAWTLHLIHLPYAFVDNKFYLVGNLPSGEILVAGVEQEEEEEEVTKKSSSKSLIPSVYSYHHTQGCKKLATDIKFPSSFPSIGEKINKTNMYYHVEDITPLHRLICNGK